MSPAESFKLTKLEGQVGNFYQSDQLLLALSLQSIDESRVYRQVIPKDTTTLQWYNARIGANNNQNYIF